MQRYTTVAAVLALLATVTFAFATPKTTLPAQPAAKMSRAYLHSHNIPGHGVAIEGYSPVSYFDGKAEQGSAMFAVEHDGITYHLTNSNQVATFTKNPTKFVPAFGGWCAFGMAVQDKFPVDPTNFKIVDGQILLFLKNTGVDALEIWNGKSEQAVLKDARAHWKKVQG